MMWKQLILLDSNTRGELPSSLTETILRFRKLEPWPPLFLEEICLPPSSVSSMEMWLIHRTRSTHPAKWSISSSGPMTHALILIHSTMMTSSGTTFSCRWTGQSSGALALQHSMSPITSRCHVTMQIRSYRHSTVIQNVPGLQETQLLPTEIQLSLSYQEKS